MTASVVPERSLTPGEIHSLSAGLWAALRRAGSEPRIVGRASPLARVASLWRGGVPILTLGDRMFWPDAPQDCSRPGLQNHMAILQHELQHVLDFATGRLSAIRYAVDPGNWRYGYRLEEGRPFARYGAEQRASMAEDLWRLEHGGAAERGDTEALRRLIPWAN